MIKKGNKLSKNKSVKKELAKGARTYKPVIDKLDRNSPPKSESKKTVKKKGLQKK